MTMRVDDRVEVFNVYKALRLPAHYEELSMISMVESDVTSLVPYISPIDPLERALIGDEDDSEDEMIEEIEQVLNMSCNYVHGFGRFEELHSLNDVQEEKLLKVLREHKKAIGWTIADIKGISPSFCMHKNFLEDEHRPSVEQQRRLISVMKEVVKKEVIKWLDAGIIFPISDSNWIVICPEDQEKTTFTCPYDTFSFKRMSFGLCSASVTFQRCMMAILTNMVEKFVKVFMDDFSIFGSSYDDYLKNLGKVTRRNRVRHIVSRSNIEVAKAKVEVVEKLPPPIFVKGVRSFLGHAGFYRRFIKDFSKIATPLCRLLENDVTFNFDEACLKAFEELKKKLVAAPIIAAPGWSLPFELMCIASDHAIGAVLGQRKDKIFYSIYYASKTLDHAQLNYTTTKRSCWLLCGLFEKFRAYLEFDVEIRDRKGTKNQVADRLSRLENHKHVEEGGKIKEAFPYKKLFAIIQDPPMLMRRCILEREVELVLYDFHASPYGGHHEGYKTVAKVLQSRFFWPTLFKDAHAFVKKCD
ncbi:PREDICTED: uncharacterized protein LOC109244370 [Nicotiana attenuata]|uniref:uncharacterized protein LOC109244370 n=1 Tax=Nicotiana attenuata TaxID=49451 RepID=UPI0009053F30|nr:PREDICTED: uncharacterized protein LOC109244370 [Nicotiana attenuata]